MLATLTWVFLWAIIFFALGWPIARYLRIIRPSWTPIYAQLIGSVLCLYFAAVLMKFSLNISSLLPILAAVALVLWIVSSRATMSGQGLRHRFFSFSREYWPHLTLSSILAFGFLLLNTPFTAESVFARHVGPDTFGWLASANYACRGENLADLTHRVESEMGQTLNQFLFSNSAVPGALHLYQIPSATDQVVTEFMLISDRYGIPGLVGGACQTFSAGSVSPLIGLLVWAFALSAVIITKSLSLKAGRRWLVSVVGLLGLANFAVISVVLEGGVGQFLALPTFLICLQTVLSKKLVVQRFLFTGGLFVIQSFATYHDAIFLAGPVLALLFFVSHKSPLRTLGRNLGPSLRSLAVTVALGGVFVFEFVDQFRLRLFSGGTGGWPQGRIPLPANIFGITNWLPADFPQIIFRDEIAIAIDVFASLALVLVAGLAGKRLRIQFATLIFLYGALWAFVYLRHEVFSEDFWTANNYVLWKSGLFLTPAFFFLLGKASRRVGNGAVSFLRYKQLDKLMIATILFLSILGTFQWATSWSAHRVFASDLSKNSELVKLSNGYNLVINDWPRGALLPNFDFGDADRGGGKVYQNPQKLEPLYLEISDWPESISLSRREPFSQ